MILFFSGTGNSKYVAKKLAAKAGDEIISVNERIKNGNYNRIQSEKPLVFVAPIYAGRFPRVMDEFIKKTAFTGTKEAYFIGTCAQTPWKTISFVKKICQEKDFTLLGFNSVVMPQGYIAGGGTQPKSVNDETLKKAEPVIKRISEAVAAKKPLPTEKPGSGIMTRLINPIMYATMISAKAFRVTDKCKSCGMCEKRCPLNNIKIALGKPTWGTECTHCMACIAGCKNEAIEYGKKTIGKPRYYLD